MEQHTVEVTFEAEEVYAVTDEHSTLKLYRTPEDTAKEREASRENRRIIAGLVQKMPELEYGSSLNIPVHPAAGAARAATS